MKHSDVILRSLIILFLTKPTIDLTWNQAIMVVGGMPISFLHVVGVFVFLYFGRYLFIYAGTSAPYSTVFKLFILVNCISILATALVEEISLLQIVNLTLRILDSYIIYNVAFFAGRYHTSNDYSGIVKAVSFGTFVALGINFLAIAMGYGGIKFSSNASLREYGLYHDPGTLSNIAMYNIIFTVFLLHLIRRKDFAYFAWCAYCLATVTMSFYLIYIGLSRSAFILMVVFGLIYVGIFKKGLGKAATLSFVALSILIGSWVGIDFGRYEQRFQSEIMVFKNPEQVETKKDKDVDLGPYERLGSNRGQVIAYALDEISKRPTSQIIIGNFNRSHSHSDYVDVLSRNGIVGIVVYIILLFAIWQHTVRLITMSDRHRMWAMRVMSFTLITLYILYSIPFRPLGYTTVAWFMWAVLGYTFGQCQSIMKQKVVLPNLTDT